MNRRRRCPAAGQLIFIAATAMLCGPVLIAADSPATTTAASAPADSAELPAKRVVPATAPSTGPANGAPTTVASATRPVTTRPATVASAGTSSRFDTGRGNGRFGDRGQGRNANGGGGGGAPPSTGPTFQLKPMANDFAILNTRSIFVHGRLRPEVEPSSGPAPAPPEPPEVTRQRTLVFNGVTRADGLITQVTAILEDTAASKIVTVQLGDQIAGGVVTNVTLDKLEFTPTNTGKPVMVLIGQNLQAGEAPRQTSTSPSVASSGGATTGPSSPPAGTGGSMSRQPGESVADWLRRRRAAGQ